MPLISERFRKMAESQAVIVQSTNVIVNEDSESGMGYIITLNPVLSSLSG